MKINGGVCLLVALSGAVVWGVIYRCLETPEDRAAYMERLRAESVARLVDKYVADERPKSDDELYAMAKQRVLETLKCPATSTFPASADRIQVVGMDRLVYGQCDAQNGFGAMVRAKWCVHLKWDRETNHLIPCNVELEGR